MEILFGIISGIISSLGMGGGTILILLLTMFSRISQHTAQATNLIFFIPTSIVSIIINFKNKIINWKTSKKIIIFGIVGAIIGSLLANKINIRYLRKIFGVFLLFIAIFQIYQIYVSYKNENKVKNKKRNNK